MGTKKKPETGNLKLEELLKKAGFSKVRKINKRILYASIGPQASSLKPQAFSTAHAAFLQAACKHPEFIGCSEFPSLGSRLLVVHRRKLETGNLKPETGDLKPETGNLKPETGNLKPETENL